MKQIVFLFVVLVAETVSGQVEKWTFGGTYSTGRHDYPISGEYYFSPGYSKAIETNVLDESVTTIVDSAKDTKVRFFEVDGSKLYMTYSLSEIAEEATQDDDNDEEATEVNFVFSEEQERYLGHFQRRKDEVVVESEDMLTLLPETREEFGLTFQKFSIADNKVTSIRTGWLVFRNPFEDGWGYFWVPVFLKNGVVGMIVEYENVKGITIQLKEYEANVPTPEEFFSQEIPEGYTLYRR